ncbi:MAG TPA: helix-turn-helix transcriptional regulator [Actinophytocola sp.]|jgi:transcriptional regulator with XRE-family HTH domain|uniref:helix-turn-helix domain-containing protein n=1 Tax=Actinophytocola sp. TaxID=1872138 RepID=UPI002DFAA5CB|nr:helix-turn-helix transcriptional regulator [Actinophytocola sp.]
MAKRKGISVRQRRVSRELRALREERGLSCKDVALALDCSESKISRMETGERGLYADDVAAVLGFLRAPGKLRQQLVELVRDGEAKNWHEIHGKLPSNWKELVAFEREASAIYSYEPLLISGLVQTTDYIRTLIQHGNQDLSEPESSSLVEARLRRQIALGRSNALQLNLVLEEMVLRRTMGDPVMMYGQLQHLLAVAARRTVTLQVVPFDVEAALVTQGPLLILEFPTQPTLCYEETRSGSTFLEEEEHINRARLAWKRLRTVALSAEDSLRLIAEIAGKLRSMA